MSCECCKYWQCIGSCKDVQEYVDTHKKIAEQMKAEMPPVDMSDKSEYGLCSKVAYASIKNKTNVCGFFTRKEN